MNIITIPNKIVKGRLTRLNLNKVDAVVLHHMAHKSADVKTVEKWHINNGWSAIGYNFWIGFDGTVYEGRGFNVGAGVLNHNSHIISIGFQGDYHSYNKAMPDSQFNAGVNTVKYVFNVLGRRVSVKGHRDFGGSVCPGRYFPFNEMKNLKIRGDEEEMIYNYIDNNMPEWARPTITKLVEKGLLKGDEKGELGLNDTMLKLLVINDRAGLY